MVLVSSASRSLPAVMIRSILFPTDFSAVANSAFPLALAVAAQYDAIVQSVHIASGGDPHITETSRYEFPAVPTGKTQVRVIETIVPKDSDDPAQVIMKQAEQRACDLIVMASHGRSDVAQFFLGRSVAEQVARDRKSTRLNSSHSQISYAVFCLKKKKNTILRLTLANYES